MSARVLIVGVGGAGGNAVNRMIRAGVRSVDFAAVNTDAQALGRSEAPKRVRMGEHLARGLGAGGDPTLGRKAAEASASELREIIDGADMVLVVGGLGGGTGTGVAPVIAQLAREGGAFVIGVVSRPFAFEGRQRARNAEQGAPELREHVHALIDVPADRLLEMMDRQATLEHAFTAVDDVLCRAIEGLCDLVTEPGLINLEFADVKANLDKPGTLLMSSGRARGESRAADAARMATSSPLLGRSLEHAASVLVSMSGGTNLTITEISKAADIVSKATSTDATIRFGASIDPRLNDEMRITIFVPGGGPSESEFRSVSGPGGNEPGPQDWGSVGAKLPRRPQAPSDHAAATPEPSQNPPDESGTLPRLLQIGPHAPNPVPRPGNGGADRGLSEYPKAS